MQKNILYVDNTSFAHEWHDEIAKALRETGNVPEQFQDIFRVTVVTGENPDGSPRYIFDHA